MRGARVQANPIDPNFCHPHPDAAVAETVPSVSPKRDSSRNDELTEKGKPSVTQITVCAQARVYIQRIAPDFSWVISVIDQAGSNRGEPDAGSQLA
jgi:hypothetical protein